jgi:predicted DNA-binding mobile mystery protein A
MNGRQLAERMGISPPSLVRIEKAEITGRTTLRTLERAADAMDCDLVYAFAPRGTTLEALVWERARAVAKKTVDDVAANMLLEDQSVDDSFRKSEADRIAAELVRSMSREIWDG